MDERHAEYYKQKELERIVHCRILSRPNTTWMHITIYAFLMVVICFLVGFGISFLKIHVALKIAIYVTVYLLLIELYLRFLIIQIIKCYQHYAKEKTRRRCMCIPSCSEYSILVLKKYCLIIALRKIYIRLFKTCKGEEYLIDEP